MNLDEAMSAAAEKLEASATPVPEPGETTTTAAETAPETPAPESDSRSAAAARARDEAGRFAKAAEKATAQKPPAAPKGDVHGAAQAAPPAGPGKAEGAAIPPAPSAEPVKPEAPPFKAPQSWKPAAREALAKAPREVQEEALRIDHEVRKVMQESAEARRTAEMVHRTIGPMEGIARANGMDAMTFAGEGARAMAAVYAGEPQVGAQVIANAIAVLNRRSNGQALDLINAAIQNPQAAPQPTPQPQQEAVPEEERWETWYQLREFRATQPEHLDRVWGAMVGLIQAEQKANRKPDLKDIYDRACWADPDLRAERKAEWEREQQRKAVDANRTATAATQQAKAAAVSIKSRPAAPMSAKPKGLDGAMAAAREKLGM